MNRFGIELGRLMENHMSDILFSERSNREHIHLYRTDNYWVAFERSACQLSRLCPEAKIIPMRLSGFPFPVVMATFGQAQSEHFIHGLPEVEEGSDRLSFKMPALPDGEYGVWHNRQVEYLSRCDVNKN